MWSPETAPLVGSFVEESVEGLRKVDQILMNLDESGIAPEQVNALFKTFRTIKGLSGFLELDEITNLARNTEIALERVRAGGYCLTGGIRDLLADSTENMRRMLSTIQESRR